MADDHYWMQTYSGGQFFYEPGQPKEISIVDIARSLSRLPRFLGHSNNFISVAEHSLAVMQMAQYDGRGTHLQLLALLHDAHEAYIGDVPAPLCAYLQDRYAIDLGSFKHALQDDILRALEIDLPTPAEDEMLKTYDLVALAAERKLAMPSNHKWFSDAIRVEEPTMGYYGFHDQDMAMRLFENEYLNLKAQLDFELRTS